MAWIKRVLPNIVLTCVSVVVVLVLVDLICWFLPIHHTILPPSKAQGYLQFDSQLGYDIAPNQPTTTLSFADSSFEIWSNELGCFDIPYDRTQPYMYLTGDSFTWGWAPFDDKWGTHVERMTGTRVLKCGVDGYGTRQELLKATQQLATLPAPALIMVGYFGGNDRDDDLIFPNHIVYDGYPIRSTQVCTEGPCVIEQPPHSFTLSTKVWLATHSVLYTLIQRELYAPLLAKIRHSSDTTFSPQDQKTQELPRVHTDAMLGFIDIAKQKHSTLLVVLIPTKADVRTDNVYSNQSMKEFLDEHNVEYIDLLPVFKQEESLPDIPLYWDHDGHWNVEGNRIAGDAVARAIISRNLIGR